MQRRESQALRSGVWWQDRRHNPKYGKFHLYIGKNFYCESGEVLEQVAQRSGISVLGDIQTQVIVVLGNLL